MAQPSLSDVHVDVPLTWISVAYIQKQTNFIASQMFPILPVDHQSDRYYVFTKADWFRDEMKVRLDGAESEGSGYNLDNTPTYYALKWALHKDIGDDIRANSDSPLNPDRDATSFLTKRGLLRQEIQWAADFFTTGLWTAPGSDSAPAITWDKAQSTPIEDVEAARAAILSTTGIEPNKIALGYQVYSKLRNHPDIIDRLKYTSSATVTTDTLARLFDLEQVLVARAVQNTAAEGQTAAYSFVQGKNALLGYSAPGPGMLTPTMGYIFAWKGVSAGLGQTIGIKRIRMEWRNADRIEAQIAFADKVIAADLGFFWSGAVS